MHIIYLCASWPSRNCTFRRQVPWSHFSLIILQGVLNIVTISTSRKKCKLDSYLRFSADVDLAGRLTKAALVWASRVADSNSGVWVEGKSVL